MGMGLKATFPVAIPPEAKVTHFHEGKDKTVIVSAVKEAGTETARGAYHLAADFSGLCGAPVLLVGTIALNEPGEAPARPAKAGLSEGERKELAALLGGARKTRAIAIAPDKPNVMKKEVRLAGRRFAVMTVQKGPPPEVKVAGEGKDRRIVIGRRTVTFDGKRIVLGE
jgi:hypothetical protein